MQRAPQQQMHTRSLPTTNHARYRKGQQDRVDQFGERARSGGERERERAVASYVGGLLPQMRPVAEFMIRKCITLPLTVK